MAKGDTLGSVTGPQQLERLDHLRQSERRAASSRVASVIGHVIGTPLNVIAGRAGLIRASGDLEQSAEHARRIEQQVSRLADRVRHLIDALTAPELEPGFRPAVSVVTEAMQLYEPIAAQRGVGLSCSAEPRSSDEIDGASGLVVLTSLLSLATRTAAPGARILLDVEPTAPGVRFSLTIPGLDLSDVRIDRLDPPAHAGPEIQDALQVLTVCYALAARHGGSLKVARGPAPATVELECPSPHRQG